jgi:hypothetical protein
MRRCPACGAPDPESAKFCHACGAPLPAVVTEPWFRLDDLWSPDAALRALAVTAAVLVYRLQFGGLLTAGAEREESRFLLFHLGSGLLLGAGLAWARRAKAAAVWAGWILGGIAGGMLCEALEVWYTYRHLMGTLTFYAFEWFGLPTSPALIYQILQGLRAAGLALPLLVLASTREKRFGYSVFALLWALLAVFGRIQVRGAFLQWSALGTAVGWETVGFYALSIWPLAYGFGSRALTSRPSDR